MSCHGGEITTIEGIGNKKDGYHPIQVIFRRLGVLYSTENVIFYLIGLVSTGGYEWKSVWLLLSWNGDVHVQVRES